MKLYAITEKNWDSHKEHVTIVMFVVTSTSIGKGDNDVF